MNGKRFWWGLVPVWMVLAFLGGFFVRASARGELQEPPPVTFTYQGRLQDGGQPAQGNFDLRFRLYDAEVNGTLIAEDLHEDVAVNQGWFNVLLTFPASAFSGAQGYLEIAVRPAESNQEGDFTVLLPRQLLTRVPYAWQADRAVRAESAASADQAQSVLWSGISGVPSELQDGDDNTTYTAGSGLTLTGTTFALNMGDLDAHYWGLKGSALGSERARLGSTDNQSWEMIVNNVPAITLHSDSENKTIVQFNQDAGESKTIEIGERYRDNGIVAWGQVWDGETVDLTGDFGVWSVSRSNDNYGYHVVLDVSATQGSVFVVTVTPIFDSTMALTANVSQIAINQDGNPEFDVYIRDGYGNYVTSLCGFNFIVTGR
ncbi:hypothetical protein [Thermanaerothrix sp.]|jgi:hypothetical protein|uniref:hypothetical protein n=1 Tax=Thermanaerothrix sp. TaxID=2972675 RepID=UPI002ADE2745|nr:hypothetical protein [Thermanaerothrix sp.]